MPKLKTRKSISRRFKVTKTGKVLRRQAFKRHLNTKKSRKHKRRLSKTISTNPAYSKKVKKVLGVKKAKISQAKTNQKKGDKK